MKKLLTLFCFIPKIFFSQEGPDSTFIIRDAGFSFYDDYGIIKNYEATKKVWEHMSTFGEAYDKYLNYVVEDPKADEKTLIFIFEEILRSTSTIVPLGGKKLTLKNKYDKKLFTSPMYC